MKAIATAMAALILASACAAAEAPPAAQRAHAAGTCGTLGPGTGLRDGRGWVVSMLPGQHEFRMRGPGDVYVTVAKLKAVDFDPGRPYYIVIEGAQAQSVLEWKVRGGKWEPVTKEFLYPPQGTKSSA